MQKEKMWIIVGLILVGLLFLFVADKVGLPMGKGTGYQEPQQQQPQVPTSPLQEDIDMRTRELTREVEHKLWLETLLKQEKKEQNPSLPAITKLKEDIDTSNRAIVNIQKSLKELNAQLPPGKPMTTENRGDIKVMDAPPR